LSLDFIGKESFWTENWKTGLNAAQDFGQKDATGALHPTTGLVYPVVP